MSRNPKNKKPEVDAEFRRIVHEKLIKMWLESLFEFRDEFAKIHKKVLLEEKKREKKEGT